MNKFELYCMIYYALDAKWEEEKNEILGEFLSSANPFMFKDIGSADPVIYTNFCKKMPNVINPKDSYEYAESYVASLGSKEIKSAFSRVSRDEWNACLKEYLGIDHKGNDI